MQHISSMAHIRHNYWKFIYLALVFCWWHKAQFAWHVCSVDNDAVDDKLSDKSADSGDEVEHPKYSVSSCERRRFLSHPVCTAHILWQTCLISSAAHTDNSAFHSQFICRVHCPYVELSWVRIFVCGAELAVQSQRRRTMVHACWKSWVFSRRLKVLSDSSGARSEGGRLFQVAGPNTAKLRWPVEVRLCYSNYV